jgi:hypothetical protein
MTQWRLAMDEIEFRETYNLAAASVSEIMDDTKKSVAYTKQALALCLQLILSLQDRLDEIQQEVEDDE